METLGVEKGLQASSDPASRPAQEQHPPQHPWKVVSLRSHASRDRSSLPPNAVPAVVVKL